MMLPETKTGNGAGFGTDASTTHDAAVEKNSMGSCLASEPMRVYTIMGEKKKIFTIIIASSLRMISFFAGGLYYPAMYPLSRALHVSKVKINLTVTSYMVRRASITQQSKIKC
jgi:hypothetical protein